MLKEVRFKIGDKLYDIFDGRFTHLKYGKYIILDSPQERKVTDIVFNKDGNVLYQLGKAGHISNLAIGVTIFASKEEAEQKIKELKVSGIDYTCCVGR